MRPRSSKRGFAVYSMSPPSTAMITPRISHSCWIKPGLGTSLLPAAQAASPLKPITHETLWMMKRVGAPVVSPDGKWVVYSVLEPSYETDKAVSDLWLVSTDGLKPPRRITNTKAPEDDVDWSLDSSSIAFSTKPEGDDVNQIHVLDLAAGRATRPAPHRATATT